MAGYPMLVVYSYMETEELVTTISQLSKRERRAIEGSYIVSGHRTLALTLHVNSEESIDEQLRGS